MSSTSFWTCPNSTMNHLRKKGAIFDIVEKKRVLDVLWLTLDGDGFWLWLQLGSLIEVASSHSCPICSMWDTTVLGFFSLPLEWDDMYDLLLQVHPTLCTSARSSQFWVAIHDILDLVGNDREFFQKLFWCISSARCGPQNVLFCASILPCRAPRSDPILMT